MLLETLLKLLDYSVKLLEQRGRYDERVFDRIVTPAFELGEKVFQDYLQLFQDLRRKVSSRVSPEDLIRFLEEGRLRYLPVRVRLRAILGRPDLWQREEERKLVAGLFGLLCGGLSTYEEQQLDRRRRYIQTGHTLLDLLYRIDELRRETDDRLHVERVVRMVQRQEQAIRAAWGDAAEAYAAIQESVATSGKLKLRKRFRRKAPGEIEISGKCRISRYSAVVQTRALLTEIRGAIRPSRQLGTHLEQVVAEALPELLPRAREVKETVHDLDHGEPNVTPAHLQESLANLEDELDKLKNRP